MAINTDKAAKPVGKYVHAKEVGDLVFLSGVGPRHPETDEIPVGIEDQTHAVFSNVKAILEAADLSMSNVVDIMVFLTNMKDDFSRFNMDMDSAEILCATSNIILGFFLIKSHLP